MYCILTRTTGRTSLNTRQPSRGSNNSLDCHCVGKGRRDENLSHRVLAGIDWKHRARGRPRWFVAPLSRSEADGRCENRAVEFPRAKFYGHFHGQPPCIDKSAAGSGANLAATIEKHREK